MLYLQKVGNSQRVDGVEEIGMQALVQALQSRTAWSSARPRTPPIVSIVILFWLNQLLHLESYKTKFQKGTTMETIQVTHA